jgi:hypothetical protein
MQRQNLSAGWLSANLVSVSFRVIRKRERELTLWLTPLFILPQLRNFYDNIRSEIISALSLLEALIDFGEDEDIDEGVIEQGQPRN